MIIKIKVKPKSKKESVEIEGEKIVVCVKEPPEDNKANIAVIKSLAKHYNISQKSIKIKSGLRGKIKIVELDIK